MINILVTGVGSLIGQGIIKSINASKIEHRIIGADYFKHAVGLYWVDKGYLLPDILLPEVQEEDWLREVMNIIAAEKIDILLIGLDFEVEIFSRHRQRIEKETDCKVIVGEPDRVGICKDKWNTVNFLKENGFPYAESCLPKDRGEFLKEHKFPFVVKPRFGFRSTNLFVVNSLEELEYALGKCPQPIIQEFVGDEGNEYTCGSLFVDNEVASVISLKRTLKDGNTYRAFSADYPEVDRFVSEVSQRLRSFGPANYQLRITAKGPVIFEINPRFSGTTPIRALFGVNEVEILIRKVLLQEPIGAIGKKHGVVLRYFEDQFVPWVDYEG
ncbi:MAG: ATP-grasp domain-containing protein [Pseudomonadota bacterium]